MKEVIKQDQTFKTEFEGNKYSAYIKVEYGHNYITYKLCLRKYKLFKFLFWTIQVCDWDHDYEIYSGTSHNSYDGPYYDWIDDVRCFDVDEVKKIIKPAVHDYYSNLDFEKNKKEIAKQYKHKKNI